MSVYHGSPKKFTMAKPSYTKRVHNDKNGKRIIDYEGVSLHVTPYIWIALAYTFAHNKSFIHKGKKFYYSMGVNLKTVNKIKIIYIYGKNSLEYSLEKLYGNGGYLYTFDKNNFHTEKGLGINELISYEEQKPKSIKYIKNIVKEMKKEGVKFDFIDVITQI